MSFFSPAVPLKGTSHLLHEALCWDSSPEGNDNSRLVAAPLGFCPHPLDVHMQISLGVKDVTNHSRSSPAPIASSSLTTSAKTVSQKQS